MLRPPKDLEAPLILVVDDDPTMRIIAREHLESTGFAVTEAVDGREAIDLYQELEPDAILMDVMMPRVDGISACSEIRRLPGGETVPILIITGHDDLVEIERAYAAGATDFTSKPVNWAIEMHRLQYMMRAAGVSRELRSREAELRHSQKMEAVGRLAGGVAHDFNNLLTVISSYGKFAAMQLPDDHPAREDIGEMQTAAERAAELTRQLLAFSRRTVAESEPVNLNAIVTGMEGMLVRLIGEEIELRVHADEAVEEIIANPNQIEQVIMNLVVNAADALHDSRGRITIETTSAALDQDLTAGHGRVSAGTYAVLAVSDNGEGIAPEVQKQIFEPFFTTKEAGKGTGLGLSTVYGIVESAGGTITLDSKPGRGTCFRTYFPIAPGQTAVQSESETECRPVTGSETVLVVEDEESVRSIMRRALRNSGYDVHEARNGQDALAVAGCLGDRIDLVVSDVRMPVMGGREMARRLFDNGNDCKLILTSGHFDLPEIEGSTSASAAALLQKPFTPEVLLSTVRDVLDGRQSQARARRRASR